MKKIVRVCNGVWCNRYGSSRIFRVIQQAFGLKFFRTSDSIDLDYCNCLGQCARGPVVAVDDGLIYTAQEDTIIDHIHRGGEKKSSLPPKTDVYVDDNFLEDI